ncbi:MAG: zinc-ribbon domain-containing protein [Mariprofundus sp.]|nr:zinc-ribbon domain-containing protein [Mariprofundus sp.]
MEIIQCPHCQKQYAVSDALRAAAGKKIRCKHCKTPFEIIIQSRPKSKNPESEVPPSEPNSAAPKSTEPKQTTSTKPEDNDLFEFTQYSNESEDDSGEQPLAQINNEDTELSKRTKQETPEQTNTSEENVDTEKEHTKKTTKPKPAKKTLNIQLLITIALATVLLIASVAAAYLFIAQSEISSQPPKKAEKSIVTDELFKPIEVKIADPKPQPAVKEKPAAPTLPKPTSKASTDPTLTAKPIQKAAKTFNPSQVCKDVSAEYWVRSHTLATASIDTATYMKLLDQNLAQADQIRRACKDKALVGIISKAARTGDKLAWIKHEISSLLDKKAAITVK